MAQKKELLDVFIDFETYYDTHCNIRTLGVSQYLKHPEFEVMTLAYQIGSGDIQIARGDDEIRAFFASLEGERVNLVAHNMQFDGYVASKLFGFVPERYSCTLSMCTAMFQQFSNCDLDSMAKFFAIEGKRKGALESVKGKHLRDLTDEERDVLDDYNVQDVEILRQIYYALIRVFPQLELDIIDLTIRMFTQPMLLVHGGLSQKIHQEEVADKQAMLDKLGVDRKVLTSSNKFAAYLEELGYTVPYKYSEKQEKNIPALAQQDVGYLQMKENADERLQKLLAARKRLNSHLVESRSKALLARADEALPVGLKYCAAHTFRFGGNDKVNLQNLPREGPGGRLRNCLLAPPGYRLVIVDAAQIEARVNAWLAGQSDLVRAFANDEDVYSLFASTLFGFEVTKATHPDERYIGKTCILGLGYQMSARRLKDELYIGRGGPSLSFPLMKCQYFVNKYRAQYSKIAQQWEILDNMINVLAPGKGKTVEYGPLRFVTPGEIQMPNGLSLFYPRVHVTYDVDRNRVEKTFRPHGVSEPINFWGGMLTENIVQSLARTITSMHMVELNKRYRVVHMAHDEIIMCVPENESYSCLKDALEMLSIPPDWAPGLPLKGEGHIDDCYSKNWPDKQKRLEFERYLHYTTCNE